MGYNPFSLEGKTILVTGASSGIGRAAAIECSRMGGHLVVTGRNQDRLNETLSCLEGNNHEMRICDLNDSDSIIELVEGLPVIQGLVNNAGFTQLQPLKFIDEEVFKRLLQVDTIAPIILLKNLIKKKKISSGGSIVFTSSLAGIARVSPGNSMYASCKGAVSAFVRGAARELADKNIRVNAVCPAMVETEILSSSTISQEQLEKDKLRYPLKRYGKPEEIAWAMIYLLSDASSWVTGTNMVLDGGALIK